MYNTIDYNPANPNPVVTTSRQFDLSKSSFNNLKNLKLPQWLKSRQFWIRFGIGFGIFAILAGIFVVWPGWQLKDSVSRLQADGKKLQGDTGAQNVVAADKDLDVVRADLADTKSKYEAFGWTGWIPLLGGYYNDGHHLLVAGAYGIDAGKVITRSLLPFADVLGLKGQTSNDTAEGKLQKIVDVMPKIAPQTDVIASKLKLVNDEIQQVDTNRYPDQIGSLTPKGSLQSAKDLVKTVSDFMPQAKDVLTYAPQGLGSPTPKKYMVVFQNDKELRPSGGFLTAYTFATLDHGKVTTSATNDIYNLDNTIGGKPTAPAPILKYLPGVPTWNLRDSNLSPDFIVSMNTFDSMYRKSSQFQSNDGYIGMDTYFLQALLRLTGPVKLASTGDTFTADNVVTKMETYAELVFRGDPNRKGFLGDLMKEVMDRLKKSKSDQWNTIITTIIGQANQKHILLSSKDQDVQNLIDQYNWSGRIKPYDGDYLHVNDSNFAGAKANLYVTEKIVQDINITSEGSVTKKITVTETNPVRTDGWLNGPYRDWVRMYVPAGSTMTASQDAEVTTTTSADLGKTRFENFIIARPLGTSSSNSESWSVSYTLPFKVTGHTYKLLLQKQPGTDGPQVVVNLNGKSLVNEQLKTDKEYSLSF